MKLLDDLINILPEGRVLDLRIGLHWTAAVVEVEGVRYCGLASTLYERLAHSHSADIPQAGQLEIYSGRELAALSHLKQPTQASVGVAVLNALLPRQPEIWVDANAEDVLAKWGAGKRVALVGSFPFVPRLKSRVGELQVLEKQPGPGELPAQEAPHVLPQAEVVAITAMTVTNHTLEGLLKLCSPQAFVMVLGPSTPLSPILFDYGVDLLSGAIVTAIEPVLHVVSQGGNFRQVHQAGVRLVNISRS